MHLAHMFSGNSPSAAGLFGSMAMYLIRFCALQRTLASMIASRLFGLALIASAYRCGIRCTTASSNGCRASQSVLVVVLLATAFIVVVRSCVVFLCSVGIIASTHTPRNNYLYPLQAT